MKLKQATIYMLKAILFEVLAMLITASSILSLILNLNILNSLYYFLEEFFIVGILGSIPVILFIFWFGQTTEFLRNESKISYIFLGISLMFFLLLIGVITGNLIKENGNEMMNAILSFFVFGGIQTTIIGVWLGVKLNKIKSL
jgi:hypothetical protein